MLPSAASARRLVVLALLGSLAVPSACASTDPEQPRGGEEGSQTDTDAARDDNRDQSDASAARPRARRGFPALAARAQVGGFAQSWDVQVLPGTGLLVDERETGRLYLVRGAEKSQIDFPVDLWASGETGLMGLAVDPGFRKNRRFYACHGFDGNGRRQVRVGAWRLSADGSGASLQRVLVRGIDASSGRHGGCRLLIARGGALLVGTGDAAVHTNPQNRRSLAGKVLRLNRFSGKPHRGNPWAKARNTNRRYLFTYGHRNVQGLAQRSDGSFWSAEHGPDRDDEVNRLVRGGNYGWDPGPGYDEGVPMTDFSLPGKQYRARWKSGASTLATSGAAFVRGKKWGAYQGTLAVAALKAERLVFMKFDGRGRLKWTRTPRATRDIARLRSVTLAPNNDLLVTTAEGSDDAVLRVRPRG